MTTIGLTLVILIELLQYLVIFDVILSWLTLFGVKFRPKFLGNILDPMYTSIKKYIPTSFGAFDFTPIIVIFTLMVMRGLVVMAFPGAGAAMQQLIK